MFVLESARERDCVSFCVRECDCTSALINSPPISHDMFISLLPVCIVNTEPQPELRQTWWLVCFCVCVSVCVSVLVCVCQLLISTSRRLLFEGDEGQVHRGMKEIKAHRQEQEVKLPLNSFSTTQGTHATSHTTSAVRVSI